MEIGILIGIVVAGLVIIGLVVAKLYHRSTKELAFVRTGLGGQKVILNGGAVVLPVFHEVTKVNMSTLKLEVRREASDALITGDRLRVDVLAEFYVRVKPDAGSIAQAAQALGSKTLKTEELKQLIEGKFVDALRAVAALMKMDELHEKRIDFVQKVQDAVAEDLQKNGLELESVSLTGLDQTNKKHFDPDNAFDAEGLTILTEQTELRRKRRNEIEQETNVGIEQQNLHATQKTLELKREEEYAIINQQKEIKFAQAEQETEIAQKEAKQRSDSENAAIEADREIAISRASQESEIAQKEAEERKKSESAKIETARAIQENQITADRQTEVARIDKAKALDIAKQEQQIVVAQKSEEESQAKARADEAKALAVSAEEKVATARQTEIAERDKAIEIIEANKEAEREAVSVKVSADAEKQAALDIAESKRIEAQAEADAIIAKAEAMEKQYAVEAEGQTKLNAAANALDQKQIELQVRLAMIQEIKGIIAESVKPMENIDSIKIVDMNGAANGASSDKGEGSINSNAIADQMLKYRTHAPMIDAMLKEVGITDNGLESLITGDALNNHISKP